ncbi:MAG: hypothetical protein U0W65_15585 [Bacteroidia bacterium]
MTSEEQIISEKFISIKKVIIYLSVALLGYLLDLIDQPGNTIMLIGNGLFFGLLCYRCLKYKEKLILRISSIIIASIGYIVMIKFQFNPFPAASIFIFSTLSSVLIEWKTNRNIWYKIITFLILIILESFVLYALYSYAPPIENKTNNVDEPKEHVLIHHTRPKIKSEACILVWDSATAYMDINDFVTARKLLHRCNDIEPNNATILNTLGVSYFSTGDSTTALKYYFNAMKADSTKPEAYASAGCLLDMLSKTDEAIKILKIGYAKTNLDQFTHYNICFNLSIAYFHIDSCKQAKKYISIAKQHGFNEPQFDTQVKQVESAILEYCR